MGEATVGREYLKMNPENSYHIAFSSIKMPYVKLEKIKKRASRESDLLYHLPNLNGDYIIDVKSVIKENPELRDMKYHANLWSSIRRQRTINWLDYFDAIVYIENGELTRRRE